MGVPMDEPMQEEHRPRMTFWDLLQQHRDETGASEAWIMRRAGLNKGTFTAWRNRGIPRLPEHDQLVALADVLRVDYTTLLNTILHDTNYMPEAAARAQAEHSMAYRDEVWKEIRDLALKAIAETGGDPQKVKRWFIHGPGREARVMIATKARAVALGTIPPDAPGWLSELFDTPDLKAVANKGEPEGSGEEQ